MEEHPGGDAILAHAGDDSTEGFFGYALITFYALLICNEDIYLYLLFVFLLHISFFSNLPIKHFFLPSWYEHAELDSY